MSDSPIERENLTAALVRDLDDEALVEWIHALQDHGERLEARVEELEAALADGGPTTAADWEAVRNDPNFDIRIWEARAALAAEGKDENPPPRD